MTNQIVCPNCRTIVETYKNPAPTVDIIIEYNVPSTDKAGVILIERKNPPYGWALPGGFVDYGETLEAAAVREAGEETGLELKFLRQFHAYSDPARDKRRHTISVVFIAKGEGIPKAADDAINYDVFIKDNLPQKIVFDHRLILDDYFSKRY